MHRMLSSLIDKSAEFAIRSNLGKIARFSRKLSLVVALYATPVMAESGYIFPYFQSNGETGVFLAYSGDGVKFTSLNDGQAILTPPNWPENGLMRDPSIIYQNGRYQMVWTTNWTGNSFGTASSTDLKTWSTPQQVQPFVGSQPHNLWAPEIQWDPIQKTYLIVFACAMDPKDYPAELRLFATSTADFKKFSPAVPFFDPGYSVIDGQLVYDDRNTMSTKDDRWIMAYKDERNGQKNLKFATNQPDMSGKWTPIGTPPGGTAIIGPGSVNGISLTKNVEGPTLIKSGKSWRLYWDAFEDKHYGLATSPDLTTWTDLTEEMAYPMSVPRHGTVLAVERTKVAKEFFPPPGK
jgi:Glycosyl hydrolases family 43